MRYAVSDFFARPYCSFKIFGYVFSLRVFMLIVFSVSSPSKELQNYSSMTASVILNYYFIFL